MKYSSVSSILSVFLITETIAMANKNKKNSTSSFSFSQIPRKKTSINTTGFIQKFAWSLRCKKSCKKKQPFPTCFFDKQLLVGGFDPTHLKKYAQVKLDHEPPGIRGEHSKTYLRTTTNHSNDQSALLATIWGRKPSPSKMSSIKAGCVGCVTRMERCHRRKHLNRDCGWGW